MSVRAQGPGVRNQGPGVGAWTFWLLPLLLAVHVVFCHGCHRDEDNELRFHGCSRANEVGSQGQPLP